MRVVHRDQERHAAEPVTGFESHGVGPSALVLERVNGSRNERDFSAVEEKGSADDSAQSHRTVASRSAPCAPWRPSLLRADDSIPLADASVLVPGTPPRAPASPFPYEPSSLPVAFPAPRASPHAQSAPPRHLCD